MPSIYRRNLPHFDNGNQSHFLTFCTRERWKLPPRARSIVLACCLHGHGKRYDLDACVVMPDHVHLVLTPLVDREKRVTVPLSRITQVIKEYSAYRINLELSREGSVWQDESFDHVIRNDQRMADRIDYIIQNPVRRGLVSRTEEYKWIWKREIKVLDRLVVLQL